MSVPIRIRCFITPLDSRSTFKPELEVTDDCDFSGSTISAGIDQEPFDIGTFTYDDITIDVSNIYGKYSNEEDSRSIFSYLRDGSKVRIVYHDSDDTETDLFHGIIDELGTVDDVTSDITTLSVLSRDSILRKLQVSASSITNGMTFAQAISSIMDRPEITALLTWSSSNMTLGLNLPIDDGSFFDNLVTEDAINDLLIVSNSYLVLINDTIYIKPRGLNGVTSHPLYGPNASTGEQNIIELTQADRGYGQMFNSILIGTYAYSNSAFTNKYQSRQKDFSNITFVTNPVNLNLIGAAIASLYQLPHPNVYVSVPISLAKTWGFFDPATLDYPYRAAPAPGSDHVSLYGQAVRGTDRYPLTTGSYRSLPNEPYAIIGMEINLSDFTNILRLVRTY